MKYFINFYFTTAQNIKYEVTEKEQAALSENMSSILMNNKFFVFKTLIIRCKDVIAFLLTSEEEAVSVKINTDQDKPFEEVKEEIVEEKPEEEKDQKESVEEKENSSVD